MNTSHSQERRIIAIEERNSRVEKDKAWETSNTRKFLLVLFTYVVMVSFMMAIGNPNPFLNATIPTLGFYLSTLTLSLVRKFWEMHR
jgi:hypothetical protein